jgi:putative GTP pyrophosphokinase
MAVSPGTQQQLVDAYDGRRELYVDFSRTLASLIETLLAPSVQIHAISHRAKSRESFAEKITRPDKSYKSLGHVTDLAGVRITTYFADDVDKTAEMIRKEFLIDESASIDKRKYADPERFGYRSLHFVVSLRPNRAELPEHTKFEGLKSEIQVRSILQHAWAEIEHDLGYKSAAGVPALLRRKFARIAGLLELADDEFTSIRHALAVYEKAIPEKIRKAPQKVDLDLPSFRSLYSLPSAVTALDDAVARAGKTTIKHNLSRLESLLERLHAFGIQSVRDLERIALSEQANVSKFVKYWNSSGQLDTPSAGIGVFYLMYVLMWRSQDRKKILVYFNKNNIGYQEKREEAADRVLAFEGSGDASP